MEHKIGEIFEYNGEWYQCVEDSLDNCVNCCFYNGGHKKCSDKMGECFKGRRSDNNGVYFKKLEKVGEPYYNSDKKLCQQYKCYTEPLIADEIVYVFADNRAVIEIKEIKEDMEEKKLNLKPFDIQKAREGKPVCTRDGREARIVCFDRIDAKPILALVRSTDGKGEDVFDYFVNGKRFANALEGDLDLMMIPEKKEGWVNVYKGGLLDTKSYPTKKEAFDKACPKGYVDTIKINWSE